jgi:predicted Zn-dependent protease
MGSEATAGAEARKFLQESGATTYSQKEATVNGLKAIMLLSNVPNQAGVLTVLSYFISRDASIFVFHGFAAQENFDAHRSEFQKTMHGFQTLRDPGKLAVQPDRIRIRTIGRRMTLRQSLMEFGTPEADLKKLAQMNGRALTDELPANSQIKVVVKGR